MEIHQGDPLGGALFTLTHFKVLRFIANHFPSYLFPSIIDDNHIIGPPSIVSFAYEHFKTEICVIGFFIQPKKCVALSLLGLPPNFETPS
jgi:putative effector of murein hydrolase